jgi:hypothetical protein
MLKKLYFGENDTIKQRIIRSISLFLVLILIFPNTVVL